MIKIIRIKKHKRVWNQTVRGPNLKKSNQNG